MKSKLVSIVGMCLFVICLATCVQAVVELSGLADTGHATKSKQ